MASGGMELVELLLQALLHALLDQLAELLHQLGVGPVDEADPVALATHEAGPLQLGELAADVGLAEPGGLDQGGDIAGTLAQMAEELEPGRLAQQPEELAELLQQLWTGNRTGTDNAHGNRL